MAGAAADRRRHRCPMKPLARPFPQRRAEPRRAGPPTRRRRPRPARFPAVRMRRNRKAAWSRRLVAENVLTPADLIWPIFVTEGEAKRMPVESMPGVDRLSVDLVAEAAEEAVALGIPVIALFPYTDAKLRTEDGREAFNADNLVCRATRAMRKAGPRHRRPARRGARPLHQPRPRRPDARAARSSTTRRWARSCARRWCRRKPAATSSRPPT